jgi:cobyrinic acid a,c-diamide synthase
MIITAKKVADKLDAYLHHRLSLAKLVDWAETAMMEAEFDASHYDQIRDTVARLGLADVRAFGLTWEDCEQFLQRLGYEAQIEISMAHVAALVREQSAKYGK